MTFNIPQSAMSTPTNIPLSKGLGYGAVFQLPFVTFTITDRDSGQIDDEETPNTPKSDQGPKSIFLTDVLSDIYITQSLPEFEFTHRVRIIRQTVGTSSYYRMIDAITDTRTTLYRRRILRRNLELWIGLRSEALRVLRSLPSGGNSKIRHRILTASQKMDEEIQNLLSLTTNRPSLSNIEDKLNDAFDCSSAIQGIIWDALCIQLNLQQQIYALWETPAEELHGGQMDELVFLARAGTKLFRYLSALQLATVKDPRAVTAIEQLKHDAEICVRLAAGGNPMIDQNTP